MKIVISGGHITPALALIEYLQEFHPEIEIVVAGRKYSRDSVKQSSIEEQEVTAKQIPFIHFNAPKLETSASIGAKISLLFRFPASVISAIFLLLKVRPKLFISFGSYQAVPLAVAAWLLSIPIITHEQTRTISLATRLITPFAKKVALSHKETLKYVPSSKGVVTGNVIRRSLFTTNPTKPEWLQTTSTKPVLYITGGNQGSEIINSTSSQLIQRLTKKWIVIHQCGRATETRYYKKELSSVRNKLPAGQKNNYYIKEWITETDLQWIYATTQLVVSRAGANTVEEIIRYCIPSVLIPLPFSRQDEQYKSADFLSKQGAAYLLNQRDLNPDTLMDAIQTVQTQATDMKTQLQKIPQTKDADKKLYELMSAYL